MIDVLSWDIITYEFTLIGLRCLIMLKVLDVFEVGTKLSVTLEGECENVFNGSHLIDDKGNIIIVESIAMIRHKNPSDIKKSTTVLIEQCSIEIGTELFMLQ